MTSGDKFGDRYRLFSKLGEGGMGSSFRVRGVPATA